MKLKIMLIALSVFINNNARIGINIGQPDQVTPTQIYIPRVDRPLPEDYPQGPLNQPAPLPQANHQPRVRPETVSASRGI